MNLCTTVILPIHEHGISFHLFVSSISFISILQSQCINLSPHWLDLLLGILTFFVIIVNGIAFLISFSDSLWLVYKNVIDFCVLILDPADLLYLSLQVFGEVCTYKIISSALFPFLCCLQETHLTFKDTHRLKVNGWVKILHANGNQKEQG